MGSGSTVKGVRIDAIKKLPLSVPADTEEQLKITSVLHSAEVKSQFIASKIEHLRNEKNALMQQLLTGKRRVKVNKATI